MTRKARPPCFSVYLLTPEAAPFRFNRSYIGKSVDPFHRQRQHNGEVAGGARRTRRYRPWEIVCIVSGFEDEIAALKFEWIWQHPYKSKITRDHLSETIKGRRGVGGQGTIKRKLIELHCILATFFYDKPGLSLHFLDQELYNGLDKSLWMDLPSSVGLHVGVTKNLAQLASYHPDDSPKIASDALSVPATLTQQSDEDEDEEEDIDNHAIEYVSMDSNGDSPNVGVEPDFVPSTDVIDLTSPQPAAKKAFQPECEILNLIDDSTDDDVLSFDYRKPLFRKRTRSD